MEQREILPLISLERLRSMAHWLATSFLPPWPRCVGQRMPLFPSHTKHLTASRHNHHHHGGGRRLQAQFKPFKGESSHYVRMLTKFSRQNVFVQSNLAVHSRSSSKCPFRRHRLGQCWGPFQISVRSLSSVVRPLRALAPLLFSALFLLPLEAGGK